MDYNSIDKSTLTDLQRRNLAAWRLKQFEIKQQYGDKVQIVNSLDDVLKMTHPLTIPTGAINTDRQLSIMMEELRETPDGVVTLVHERGEAPIASTVSDVTLELERQVDLWEQIEAARTARKYKREEFVVPKGYKLVKIEDETPSPNVSKAADILVGEIEVKDNMGVPVPQPADKLSKEAAAKALLDMLI